MSTYKYKRHSRAICYCIKGPPGPPTHTHSHTNHLMWQNTAWNSIWKRNILSAFLACYGLTTKELYRTISCQLIQTLPEAQRTQTIDSVTWFISLIANLVTCIVCKFGHQVAPLIQVANVATSGATCIIFDLPYWHPHSPAGIGLVSSSATVTSIKSRKHHGVTSGVWTHRTDPRCIWVW